LEQRKASLCPPLRIGKRIAESVQEGRLAAHKAGNGAQLSGQFRSPNRSLRNGCVGVPRGSSLRIRLYHSLQMQPARC